LLLTTQYLEEADRLADDIIVIDHGREIAHGTADDLKGLIGGERIELTLSTLDEIHLAREVLARFTDGELQVDEESRTLVAPISGGAKVFTRAVGAIDDAGIEVHDVGLRRQTLDDVFLSLTGHHAVDETDTANDATEEVST
jgi:ABC-2 type transport system ATP-binding protein